MKNASQKYKLMKCVEMECAYLKYLRDDIASNYEMVIIMWTLEFMIQPAAIKTVIFYS